MKTLIVLEIDHEGPLPGNFLRRLEDCPEQFAGIEVWRPAAVDGYEVSSEGRARRIEGTSRRRDGTVQHVRGGVLRPGQMKNGYQNICFSAAGDQRTRIFHREVLKAFAGDAPEGYVCRHLNGIRNDNKLVNLEWGTNRDNEADKVRHGTSQRGERHGGSKLTEQQVEEIRKDGRSRKQVAHEYGISALHVGKILRGEAWSHLK